MLLFRSEEHVGRWLERTGHPFGSLVSVTALWELAAAWYTDKARPGYRRRTMDEAHALFERAGLTGPFWRLDAPGSG